METEYEQYVAHKRLLEETLRSFPARKRLFFAVHCCDQLWQRFGISCADCVTLERGYLFRNTYESLWASLEANTALPVTLLNQSLEALNAIEREIVDQGIYICGGEDETTYLVLYYVIHGACIDDPNDAVTAGTMLVDYADRAMSEPDMLLEYARQRELLRFLADTDTFAPGDRTRFPMPLPNESE